MLTLDAGDYRLEITNAPPHDEESVDNVNSYDVTWVERDQRHITSRHALRLFQQDQQIRSCLLSAGGGATGIHDHTAIIQGHRCVVAVGQFVVSIAIPALTVNWATRTDEATCFGVYVSTAHDCLISHGELDVSRVTHGGAIVWQTGGADIFTGEFEVEGEIIRVTDFEGRVYLFDIETGQEITSD